MIAKIEYPVFKFTVYVGYRETKKSIEKYIFEKFNSFAEDASFIEAEAFTQMLDNENIIIVFNHKDVNQETLTHESCHAIFIMFNKRGMNLEMGSQEAYAYYIGNLANRIARFTQDTDKKTKKKK